MFERKYVLQFTEELDVAKMQAAATYFIGSHDFSAFCANKHIKKSTVRHIHSFCIERIGPEIQFSVTGNGFLHHMVRIMVGTLLEVGICDSNQVNY